jgi:hypothetical protein
MQHCCFLEIESNAPDRSRQQDQVLTCLESYNKPSSMGINEGEGVMISLFWQRTLTNTGRTNLRGTAR